MQATLIYNHHAGTIRRSPPEAIQDALRDLGFEPVYRATSSEVELDEALKDVEGLVVTAGGDGTIRAVATRLIGKPAQLTPLPLGTANNICKSLCLGNDPLAILRGLRTPVQRSLDVGYLRAPWGEDYFLEAAGYGLYADTLAAYDPDEGKSVPRAVSAVLGTLRGYLPHQCQVILDGEDISADYLVLEVLNTSAVGPRLKLAPQADPGDGLFEIVGIRSSEQAGFTDYLAYAQGLFRETLGGFPNVKTLKGKRLELAWRGFPMHVDGEVRPRQSLPDPERQPAAGESPQLLGYTEAHVTIEIIPRALTLLLPGQEGETRA